MAMTSIGIDSKTKAMLTKLKVHKRESFDDLLNRMIEKIKSAGGGK